MLRSAGGIRALTVLPSPDLRFAVDLLLGDGDLVAARWTATGTHTGAWADQEPTGRSARFSGVDFFRFRDGKVDQHGAIV